MDNQIPSPSSSMDEISLMLIRGVEEILGQDDVQILLRQDGIAFDVDASNNLVLQEALTFTQIKKLETRLSGLFGEMGMRGAILRTGRAFFQEFYQKYGIQSGLNSLDFRMLPVKKRILSGLKIIANLLSDTTTLKIETSDDEANWYWKLEDTVCCKDVNGNGVPVCDFSVGLLQSYLIWASGGKSYPIQKKHTSGSGCMIEIGKKAIG